MLDGKVMPAFFINKIMELVYLNIILGVYMDSCPHGFSHSLTLIAVDLGSSLSLNY